MDRTARPVPAKLDAVGPVDPVGLAPIDPAPVDVVDLTDDHARLSVDRLPRSATRLGCRMCGLTAEQHGPTVIHRFVRPHLPHGYRYLDEVEVGDELALRRAAGDDPLVQVEQLDRALVPNDHELLWLRTAHDCFLLHPATVVRSRAVAARAA